MQMLQTWRRTSTWDPTNPNQKPTQYWDAASMGYRSAYWNMEPTTGGTLMGVIPDNKYAQVGLVAALTVGAYLLTKKMTSKGMFGLAGARRRKRRT